MTRRYVFKRRWKRIAMSVFDAAGRLLLFWSRPRVAASPPTSILVVRIDQVGDVIQSLPFFESLRRKYPTCRIMALCVEDSAFLLRGNPNVDEVVALRTSWFYPGRSASWRDLYRTFRAIRLSKPDLTFELRGDLRTLLFLAVSGARNIHGYGCAGGGFLLSQEYDYDREQHEVDKNLRMLGESSPAFTKIGFPSDGSAEAEAATILRNGGRGKKIAIHPFSNAPSKMWGMDRYGALIDKISAQCAEAVFFVLGSPEDSSFMNDLRNRRGVVDCTGQLSFRGTLELIKRADLFIGNDSAPQYLAAYTGIRTCIIYGYSVNFLRWKPKVPDGTLVTLSKPVYCGPCESSVCANHREGHICMERISVDDVFERLKDWL